MRGDGVGVGDIDEVHGGTRSSGHSTGGDDGRGSRCECDAGLVDGHGGTEHGASKQPGGHGLGIGDGAWGKHGAGGVHGQGSGGADGMRGDGVGVGDIDEVHGGTRSSGHTTGGDDGRGARCERDAGLVDGHGGLSMVRRSNRAGTGSASVTVHGASMGLVAYTGKAREGQTGCEATEWESETSMRCHGGTRSSGHTTGGDDGRGARASVTQSWSTDMAGLSMVRRSNRAGTGSASVTVHGASMGLVAYTGKAREGQTGCEATEWESETSMRCMVGHGARGTRRVVMTAGDRGASVTAGLVGGHGGTEHGASKQPGGHGLGIGDGAWGKHGAGGVHGQGSGGTDRMRGDGVGVGDIDEVHGGTRSSGHPTGGDDGRGSRCECV